MTRIATSLAGVCIVRDACDLIGLVCGHYLRIGVGHIRFIDDGSTDGTYQFLSRLAHKDQRVSVARVDNPEFRQAELISEAANELASRGFNMILPFDVDEFWNISGPELEKRYAWHGEVAFRGRWINFVQSAQMTEAKPFYLLRTRYSAPALDDANEATVCAYKSPFVGFTTTKIGFKAVSPVQLDLGQHNLLKGPKECSPIMYQIFHLPFRNKSEIIKRALDHEPRRSPSRTAPSTNWQSLFHRQAVLAGRIDEVWLANSADRYGFLNCGGERIVLARDRRMQEMLIKSNVYMALRHRMLLS